MGASETQSEMRDGSRRRCLMCWEVKGPTDFEHDALYGWIEYCRTCDTIQRAHARAHLRAVFDWAEPDPPYSILLNGAHIGERWRKYIVEYLYGSVYHAMTQRYLFAPDRYRGPTAPLLDDGVTPLVWRIRLFHMLRKGYAEGWWNPRNRQWDWSLHAINLDMPAGEWSDWRKAIRDSPTLGRPLGTTLTYLTSVEAFLARVREVVSEGGWAMALPGADAITRKRVRQSVREGRVTQAQLGEILGCDRRTIWRALVRFKEENQLDWPDLRQRITKWSHEP
jgi:hypothetical protein